MNLLKMLIGLPVLMVVLVFAFVNNDLVVFSLWPFAFEITVSLSVAIVFLFTFGRTKSVSQFILSNHSS